MYVHGGYAGAAGLDQPVAALLRYNPARDRWRRMRSSATPRAAHAAAAIGARLYVAGGANDTGSLRSLEIYDSRTGRWCRGPSFPGPARNHTAGVASGGRFYVLAGRVRLRAAHRHRRRASRAPRPITVASVYVPNGGKDFDAKLRFLGGLDTLGGRRRRATAGCCLSAAT